jgi:voltage-gated potassium channel
MLAFLIVLFGAGTLQYVFEREAQPDSFGSIPAALWWTIVTLTTTGYGDVVPATLPGRVLAGAVMVCGIAVFGLWAGILASSFSEELRRRDFLRAWDLVARVPFLHALGAGAIADVSRLLRPQEVGAGTAVVRRGQRGDCMFFIVDGEVEVALDRGPLRLGSGDFFGEIALVTAGPRSATVSATRPTTLLVLDVADFRELAARRPELTAAVEAEAARRLVPAAPPR